MGKMKKEQLKKKKAFSFLLILLLCIILVFAPNTKALELVISNNGTGSVSEVSVQTQNAITVEQVNEGEVDNNVSTSSNTGENLLSANTGSNVTVTTGDSHQDINIENSLNQLLMDSNCCSSEKEANISGNGNDSTNTINLSQSDRETFSLVQTAIINNSIEGVANTGDNTANSNTSGDVSIQTGDISVAGQIINGPVNTANVYLKGSTGWSAKISQNGDGSTNTILSQFNNDTEIYTRSLAEIENFVVWNLNTGRNLANSNTSGELNIKTGDISLEFFIRNLANIARVEIDCCGIFNPGDDDEQNGGDFDGEEGLPVGGGEENQRGESGDGSVSESQSSGSILPSAAATEAGGPGIVGLSDTSSGAAQTLFFWVGLLMIAFGGRMVVNEIFPHLPKGKK
ncbi:hypothetical protein A2892_01450 [Candidatus Woesebacteria bacterium RIFCSPLOWO2_01_FULL_39_10b]|uniref:Uncharacterized protein n=1 Tax=Candidatus Woesebacteria bacterium RIFCSPLOWO2_01_FULL_39_10b TaxID=1802517 RepID=A0A1F8B9H6_9BACT|nr:MAG: hypothetical protein A2892_01450 [Candidatus Woesebacteria bacterium RIFCSPLOWO2_01_FULL_39_10b]